MLFNINRQKSLALLQLTSAAFILLAPSLVGMLPAGTAIYLLFTVLAALLAIRIKTNERIFFSIYHAVYLFLAVYAVISSAWVNNREGQLLLVTALLTLSVFHCNASDYFAENSSDNIKRRAMYLLAFSGALCAVFNIVYWIVCIVPIAGNEALKQGLLTNDFLAIFMYFSMICTLFLFKGNSRLRKAILVMSLLMMVFVFVMAKSISAWLLAVLYTLVLIVKAKSKSGKGFVLISIGGTVVFLIGLISVLSLNLSGQAFRDVFAYGSGKLFGAGGGFWSGREIFASGQYTQRVQVGLLAYLFAACGVPGVICCICALLRNVILLFKLKTPQSLIGLFLCISIMILPLGENLTVILLWIGINAYNEQMSVMNFKLQIKKQSLEKAIYAITIAVVISSMLVAHSIIRINASLAYKNKEYTSACELYKIAATLNFTDSESCRKTVASMRKSGEVSSNKEEAVRIIDKAIKRDSDNLQNIREKALVYDECGEFELSAQQYRVASQMAFQKDEYNLLLVKELYKIIKKHPKGSSETKRAYEEIVAIAQATDNLDYKKEINDIADKALKFRHK